VIEKAEGSAGSYAGRLLGCLGAVVVKVERPRSGDPLRFEPPFVGNGTYRVGALFCYLNVNKWGITLDLNQATGRALLDELAEQADILIDDTSVAERTTVGVHPAELCQRHPDLVFLSVLPFGAEGPHRDYMATDLTVFHSGGEGYLLPNGLAYEAFPARPPLKGYGHLGELQGGTGAAVAAIAGLMGRRKFGGQTIDVSLQDVNVALSGMNIQRYGDGALETRAGRSFTYGGVLQCKDGYIELLTLEQRQWDALVTLMGSPEWALTEGMATPIGRGERGAFINQRLREWAKVQNADEIVHRAQENGVPMARYLSPVDVMRSEHERVRGSFQDVDIPEVGTARMLVAPFKNERAHLTIWKALGRAGCDNHRIWNQALGHSEAEMDAWLAAGVL
jgi:crotonobetainyl-CoA:carnitine CoA-transferase CaiB-like acyl-CoA transferase